MTLNTHAKIGLGTAAIGRPLYINIRQEKAGDLSLDTFKQKAREVLETAYANGIRYYDTAPNYGFAEALLIDWVGERQDENIEVASKWGYTYTANFDPEATEHEVKEHSLSKLNEQWGQTENLIPFLSTYQIHSATLATGVLDNNSILERLAMLKAEHHLKIGITTSGANQSEVIAKAATIQMGGDDLFDAYQVTYNIMDQSLTGILSELKSNHKRLIIKEIMANGRVFPNPDYPNYQKLYAYLQGLADKYEVGIDAIALRFCMDSLQPQIVLSGAAKPEHVLQNLKAYDFQLSPEEVNELRSFAVDPESYWAERKQLTWQ